MSTQPIIKNLEKIYNCIIEPHMRFERFQFLRSVIVGSGFECENWMDFVTFNNLFQPEWNDSFIQFKIDGTYPSFQN